MVSIKRISTVGKGKYKLTVTDDKRNQVVEIDMDWKEMAILYCQISKIICKEII